MNRLRDRLRNVGPDDGGFTIVEAVVAVVLLAVLAVGVEASVLGTMQLTVESQRRVTATHLAARELALVREAIAAGGDGADAILDSGTVVNPHPLDAASGTLKVSGVEYSLTRTVSYRTVVGDSSVCDAGGTSLASGLLARVDVDVTWPGRRAAAGAARIGEVMLGSDAAGAGSYSWIAIKVTDNGAPPAPVGGARASVVNHSTSAAVTTVTTDASGCAVARVNPGSGASYDVVVSKPGFVSPGWAEEPRLVVGVLTADSKVHQVSSTLAAASTLKFTLVDDSLAPVGSAAAGKTAHLVADTGRASEGDVSQQLSADTWQTTDVYPGTYGVWVTDGADPGTPPVPLPRVTVGPGKTVELLVSATRGIVAVVNDGVVTPVGGAGP